MGREAGWCDTDIGHLARALVYAPEEAIDVVDQTATRFHDTLLERFKSFAPQDFYVSSKNMQAERENPCA